MSKTDLKDFLLADYKYIGDSLWRNEEIGEKRIKFFIALVTAVITALVTLGKSVPEKDPGFKNGELLPLAATVAVLLVSFVIQYVYIRIKDKESKSALRSSEYIHAGGIVFRTSNSQTEYLLVTAK